MAASTTQTGAVACVKALQSAGVDVCFANPGTTEMFIVAGLDATPGVRAVLGLHETVCSGAADGYGRMARKPAATLLHLGPGLANSLANLHNARRARSPVVNLVGDMASWHASSDAPLCMDIEALAGTVSGWVRTCKQGAEGLAVDAAEAVAAAMVPASSGSSRVGTSSHIKPCHVAAPLTLRTQRRSSCRTMRHGARRSWHRRTMTWRVRRCGPPSRLAARRLRAPKRTDSSKAAPLRSRLRRGAPRRCCWAAARCWRTVREASTALF